MVELAVVLPLLLMFIFGIIEFGRTLMVLQLLNSAAREGGRVGTLEGVSTSEVSTTVKDRLDEEGIDRGHVSVETYVNGTKGEVSGAATGDIVSVRVAVVYSDVSYLPTGWFLDDATTLRADLAVRRE